MTNDKGLGNTERAAHAHSNLNIFAGVVSLLEGGTVYPNGTIVQTTTRKIIALCKKEQQRQSRIYDRERGR